MKNGLYYLEVIKIEKVLLANQNNEDETWHRRLGHISFQRLILVPNLNVKNIIDQYLCDACCRAKQTRLPFPVHKNKTKIFDIIYCDIWGPYHTQSHSGAKYFLTLVDDYSRAKWIFLMKQKSETKHYLILFLNWVQTKFNSKVKILRTDNGLEFQHTYLVTYYLQNRMER